MTCVYSKLCEFILCQRKRLFLVFTGVWVVKVTDIIRTKAEPVDNNVNHFYFSINEKCSQVDWLSSFSGLTSARNHLFCQWCWDIVQHRALNFTISEETIKNGWNQFVANMKFWHLFQKKTRVGFGWIPARALTRRNCQMASKGGFCPAP